MKTLPRHRTSGFTLLEILIVIAIIAVLAALTLGGIRGAKLTQAKKVAATELEQLSGAIDAYKRQYGSYPRDNPGNPILNPLYFELIGSTNDGNVYVSLDGGSSVNTAEINTVFNVAGFLNSSRITRNTDEQTAAKSFIKALPERRIGQLVVGNQPARHMLLLCSVRWGDDPNNQIVTTSTASNPHAPVTGLNPWRYVSTHPTHNPDSYDLWIEFPFGGKIYRVSNWSKQAEVL